jgi:hypothetical protein
MTKKIFVIKNTQLPLNKPKTKKKSKNRHFFGSWGGSLNFESKERSIVLFIKSLLRFIFGL